MKASHLGYVEIVKLLLANPRVNVNQQNEVWIFYLRWVRAKSFSYRQCVVLLYVGYGNSPHESFRDWQWEDCRDAACSPQYWNQLPGWSEVILLNFVILLGGKLYCLYKLTTESVSQFELLLFEICFTTDIFAPYRMGGLLSCTPQLTDMSNQLRSYWLDRVSTSILETRYVVI